MCVLEILFAKHGLPLARLFAKHGLPHWRSSSSAERFDPRDADALCSKASSVPPFALAVTRIESALVI